MLGVKPLITCLFFLYPPPLFFLAQVKEDGETGTTLGSIFVIYNLWD